MLRRQTLLFSLVTALTVFAAGSVRPGGKPNLILLSVDTLRADHLGAYGYGRPTSPHLDQLLASGTMFTDALCNVPLTNPSFSSMLTSRYPHQTGSTRNGMPALAGQETLAVYLKARGYHTAAVLSNWPLKAHLSGLKPGFDLYDDAFFEKRWLIFNSERDAAGVTAHAAAWLSASPPEPFFLWVHYSDPHSPYLDHEGFSFRDPKRTGSQERQVDDYDSEVAYADHSIGEFLAALAAQPFARRTLIAFVADHGESLGEHDYTGHGRNLYQPSLRVPFGLSGAGIPQGRLDFPAELLDLAPTVLAYLGFPPGKRMLGRDLLPLVQGRAQLDERPRYFETYPGAARRLQGAEELLSAGKPIWIGFREGPLKVSYSPRSSRWEFFHLAEDPGELKNLAKVADPAFVQLSERLMDWHNLQEKEGWAVGRTDAVTDEDRARLESLGYVDH